MIDKIKKMTNITEEQLIESEEVREELIGRIDVFDKVKGLLLLPALEMATTKQVAEFTDVSYNVIEKVWQHHKDEIKSDGARYYRKAEVVDALNGNDFSLENKKGKSIVTFDNGNKMEIPSRGLKLFPKRAILRVGMLLRDSEVAKEVRTQLLNIEEKAPNEVKTGDIEKEQEEAQT